MIVRSETLNILQLSIGFLFILFAFNSQGFIAQTIIDGKKSEGTISKHAGYVSFAIIYGAFTLTNIVAASIIGILRPKTVIVISACFYGVYECGFLFLNELFLYISSAMLGIAASLMWIAQGKYMAINSTKETASLHSGLFWGVSQICITGGGVFLYITFTNLKEHDTIDNSTIRLLYSIFMTVSIVGTAILILLRTPNQNRQSKAEAKFQSNVETTFLQRMKSTFSLLTTKRMLLLTATFVYTGVNLSFWSSIYPSSISFTNKLAVNTKTVIALNAIALGLGQVTAGLFFGIMKETTKKIGRARIVLIGTTVHILAYMAIYANFPSNAPLGKTEDEGMINPNPVIAVICGYLLGFGDGCWHTQVFFLLILRYNKQSAEAFSLFKLFQGLTTSTSFLYATKLTMEYHILILVVAGLAGFTGFFIADTLPMTKEEEENEAVSDDDQ